MSRLHRLWRRPIAALLMAALLTCFAPRLALAQEDGPVTITSRPDIRTLVLHNFAASLEFRFRHSIEHQEPQNGPNTRDTETRLEELFNISVEGFVMHPNLIDFSLDAGLELSEQFLDSDTSATQDQAIESFDNFDLRTTVLGRSNSPIALFAQRSHFLIDRQFTGSIDSVNTAFGVSAPFRVAGLGNVINYAHRQQSQTGSTGLNNTDTTEDNFDWQGQFSPSPTQRVTIDYSFQGVEENSSQRSSNTFDRHELETEHVLDFGSKEQHQLRSTMFYLKQLGDFANDNLRLNEQLRLKWSEDLQSTFSYFFDRQDRAGTTQMQHRANMLLRHELYDSLISVLNVGGSLLELSDNTTNDEIFGNLNLDYTKIVPCGLLTLNLGVGLNRQHNAERGEPLDISLESHTFVDPFPVILARRNIDPSSIVLHAVPGPGLFAINTDYSLLSFADRIEISRILTGLIANNETVEIDYTIGPEPDNVITTTSLSLSSRYDIDQGPFKGLALYTRYFDLTQDLDSSNVTALVGDSVRDIILGAEYRYRIAYLEAEYKLHDSEVSPFKSLRLESRLFQRSGRQTLLSLDTTYTNVIFTDDDFSTTLMLVSANATQRLTDKLFGRVELLWRQQDNSSGIDSQGFEQEVELEWNYRQTTIYFSARNTMFSSDTSENMFQTIEMGISRDF